MVLLDYLFASQMVIEWCEAHPLPNDDASLADLLMPARLSMDGADVFGVRPAYHRDNVARAGLPSHVWNHVPVLQLAMSVRPMVDALADEGQWSGILESTKKPGVSSCCTCRWDRRLHRPEAWIPGPERVVPLVVEHLRPHL